MCRAISELTMVSIPVVALDVGMDSISTPIAHAAFFMSNKALEMQIVHEISCLHWK